jgi:hypothetical protein
VQHKAASTNAERLVGTAAGKLQLSGPKIEDASITAGTFTGTSPAAWINFSKQQLCNQQPPRSSDEHLNSEQ